MEKNPDLIYFSEMSVFFKYFINIYNRIHDEEEFIYDDFYKLFCLYENSPVYVNYRVKDLYKRILNDMKKHYLKSNNHDDYMNILKHLKIEKSIE